VSRHGPGGAIHQGALGWRDPIERVPAVIPDSFKQELLHRVDIVDVIERYVPLKKGGRNYLRVLPVPHRKTPFRSR